jgi:hypothetical protein
MSKRLWDSVAILTRTGRQFPSTTTSTISRCGAGSRVAISEKYRQPAGPGAHRKSSVPTALPSPSITTYRPCGTGRMLTAGARRRRRP